MWILRQSSASKQAARLNSHGQRKHQKLFCIITNTTHVRKKYMTPSSFANCVLTRCENTYIQMCWAPRGAMAEMKNDVRRCKWKLVRGAWAPPWILPELCVDLWPLVRHSSSTSWERGAGWTGAEEADDLWRIKKGDGLEGRNILHGKRRQSRK